MTFIIILLLIISQETKQNTLMRDNAQNQSKYNNTYTTHAFHKFIFARGKVARKSNKVKKSETINKI